VILTPESPSALAHSADGAEKVVASVRQALSFLNVAWAERNSLVLRRGPYVIAAGLTESIESTNTTLTGQFVNLFDSRLPVLNKVEIIPDSHWLLYDLAWSPPAPAWVIAASGLVAGEEVGDQQITFVLSAPTNTTAVARILLPLPPRQVASPSGAVQEWEAASRTLFLAFPAEPRGTRISIHW